MDLAFFVRASAESSSLIALWQTLATALPRQTDGFLKNNYHNCHNCQSEQLVFRNNNLEKR